MQEVHNEVDVSALNRSLSELNGVILRYEFQRMFLVKQRAPVAQINPVSQFLNRLYSRQEVIQGCIKGAARSPEDIAREQMISEVGVYA